MYGRDAEAMDADHPHPLRFHVLEGAPVGMGALDPDLTWAWVNPALATLSLEIPDAEALRPVVDDGDVLRRSVTGGANGTVRHWDVSFFRLGEEEGIGVAAVEVTDRRRRDALLARAGQFLGTALSVKGTADLITRLLVPEIADWCFVELATESGQIDRVSYLHRDASKVPWLGEVVERYPLDPESPVGSPKVIRTGEPELWLRSPTRCSSRPRATRSTCACCARSGSARCASSR